MADGDVFGGSSGGPGGARSHLVLKRAWLPSKLTRERASVATDTRWIEAVSMSTVDPEGPGPLGQHDRLREARELGR